MKHFIVKLLYSIIIAYAFLCILLYLLGNKLTFPAPKPSYSDSPEIIKLILPDGKQISARYFYNSNAQYTILYSHGNGEDLGHIRDRLLRYHDAGFSILSYDYPGYGTSQGKPNEKNVYDSIAQAYTFLTQTKKIPPSDIILFGRSLGAAATLELALKQTTAAIVLESPFLSAFRTPTFYRIFPWDTFKTDQKISQISAPILIIHGTSDRIIPISHGKALFLKAPEPKSNLWVQGAGHNDLLQTAGQSYWNALYKFIHSL